MRIGDFVSYQGRRYVVVGFTPFSVRPFRVELENPKTKERFWRDWPPDEVERAALRLADKEAEA